MGNMVIFHFWVGVKLVNWKGLCTEGQKPGHGKFDLANCQNKDASVVVYVAKIDRISLDKQDLVLNILELYKFK